MSWVEITYTDSDIALRHKILAEIRNAVELEPSANHSTIYVLSGPEKSIYGEGDPNTLNETRARWETGMCMVKAVAAKRLDISPGKVTSEDIRLHGPTLYFSGPDCQQQELTALVKAGKFEKEFGVPSDKIRIEQRPDIRFTWHQFAYFPADLLPVADERLVVVSSAYHIPRIKDMTLREKFDLDEGGYILNPIPPKRVDLFAARPLPYGLLKKEVSKFPGLKADRRVSDYFFQ